MLVFKILRAAEWAALREAGQTAGAAADRADGFIHFSTAAQLPETAARHFRGETGLILLASHAAALGPELRWEVSRGGALFPHLYRALRLTDIAWHRAIIDTPQGHDFGPLDDDKRDTGCA